MNKDFDYEKIRKGWMICQQGECPKSEECLRRIIGQDVPDSIMTAHVVMGGAWKGQECRFFKPFRYIRAAKGMKNIYKDVRKDDYTQMRETIIRHLGGNGTYYRYRDGRKLLSPEQQEWISGYFRRMGYTGEVQFDEYVEVLDMD